MQICEVRIHKANLMRYLCSDEKVVKTYGALNTVKILRLTVLCESWHVQLQFVPRFRSSRAVNC